MLTKLYAMPVLLSANKDVFKTATTPVIELIQSAVGPILGLVVAIGAIYCIFLGAKLAKAEEPQDREKAKAALKNAIVGFLLIFVLLVVLNVVTPVLTSWYESYADTTTSTTSTKK